MKSIRWCWLVATAACAHNPTGPWFTGYDEARAARLASRVKENVQCAGGERAELRIVCAARAVQEPAPFATPSLPVSLLGVIVSVPDSGPFRVRNDFGLPVLTIGGQGATLTMLYPENDAEFRESDELTGQLYELVGGARDEPLTLPSGVAAEVQRSLARGPTRAGFALHATFAEFGDDGRIFYLESFAGHPAYALLMQAETEIQLALFPVVATRTANPEFAKEVSASAVLLER